KKYDLHAVKMLGVGIELWQYKRYDNDTLYLEEVFRREAATTVDSQTESPDANLTRGQKAAATRAAGTYTVAEHYEKMGDHMREIVDGVRRRLLNAAPDVEEAPKKLYIAYKLAQNFACMDIRQSKVTVWLKLDPRSVDMKE